MTEEIVLNILYKDEHCLAINKSPGIFVHHTKLSAREISCVDILENRMGEKLYPVHRLDRATSGVLLFARHQEAARRISKLFMSREVKKEYTAVVRGFTETEGVIENPVRKDTGKSYVTARTSYVRKSVIEIPHPVGPYQTARYSRVQVFPETGRRHQIRKHFKYISHPIIGDVYHGDSAHNRFFRSHFGMNDMLLIAASLAFEHPFTGELIKIEVASDGLMKFIEMLFSREKFIPEDING